MTVAHPSVHIAPHVTPHVTPHITPHPVEVPHIVEPARPVVRPSEEWEHGGTTIVRPIIVHHTTTTQAQTSSSQAPEFDGIGLVLLTMLVAFIVCVVVKAIREI